MTDTRPSFYWYFVTHDGPRPWEPDGRRRILRDDVKAMSSALDRLGYDGALMATTGHDVWTLANTAAAYSERFSPLIAVRPQFIAAATLANMAVSFMDLHGPRLKINMINSEMPVWSQNGIAIAEHDRYRLHAEYWSVFKHLVAGETVTFDGEFVHAKNAVASPWIDSTGWEVPLWFSGSSEGALDIAGRFADNYLTFAEPLEPMLAKLGAVRAAAAEHDRTPAMGLRASLVLGETDEQAWEKASELLRRTSPATFERKLGLIARGGNGGGTSVTQSRIFGLIPEKGMEELRSGRLPERARDFAYDEVLWPGIALFQQGPPVALVGSYESVAAKLREYQENGIDTFILDSLPLLEGAYEFAEHVMSRFE